MLQYYMISTGGPTTIVLTARWIIYWKRYFQIRACKGKCVYIKVKNVGYTFYKKRNYWLLFISHLSTLTNFLISSSFWNIPRKHIRKMPEYFMCKTNAILNDDEVYDTRFVNRNIARCSDWRFAKYRKQSETRILSMLYLLW